MSTPNPSADRGRRAEDVVTERLAAAGWRILGRNVRVGRLEIDIVAVDPGPPRRLVAVEVRYRGRRDYGLPEESFDRRKRGRTLAALGGLRSAGTLPDGTRVPTLVPAVDLVVVEPPRTPSGREIVRHHRDAVI